MSGSGGRKKARRRLVYGRKPQNTLSILLVGVVVFAIFAAVTVRSISLRATLSEYEETKAELEAEIESELQRAEEIEEYAKYTQTDEYVEEVARDKLGLVREGEILFKNDDSADSTSSSASTSSAAESGDTQTEDVAADDAGEDTTEEAGTASVSLGTGETEVAENTEDTEETENTEQDDTQEQEQSAEDTDMTTGG